jgi:hypothetical protein
MITRDKALKIRALAMSSAAALKDTEASIIPEMFPTLKADNSLVPAGTRINWNRTLRKATVDLWDTVENNPDNAPELWEAVSYQGSYRVIPEVITSTQTFAKGEKGWWKDALYESLYDANVWNPDQFAAGWQKVEQ